MNKRLVTDKTTHLWLHMTASRSKSQWEKSSFLSLETFYDGTPLKETMRIKRMEFTQRSHTLPATRHYTTNMRLQLNSTFS